LYVKVAAESVSQMKFWPYWSWQDFCLWLWWGPSFQPAFFESCSCELGFEFSKGFKEAGVYSSAIQWAQDFKEETGPAKQW